MNLNSVLLLPSCDGVGIHRLKPVEDVKQSCGDGASSAPSRRSELAHLRAALSGKERHELAHATFDVGELDGHHVVLATAGMGKVNAGLVATLLADRFRCRAVVFTGVAGGLDPELRIGDIVIADRLVQHDFGLIEDERLRRFSPDMFPSSSRPNTSATRPRPNSSIVSSAGSTA